jgi:hypothetical protein
MKKNFDEYLTTPYSDPLPPKAYVPKARTMAPKNVQEREKAVREEKAEEEKPQFNQLPPGLPPIGSDSNNPKVKEANNKGEKR